MEKSRNSHFRREVTSAAASAAGSASGIPQDLISTHEGKKKKKKERGGGPEVQGVEQPQQESNSPRAPNPNRGAYDNMKVRIIYDD